MIELKQICFTYADGADGGLKDIDLTVKAENAFCFADAPDVGKQQLPG